MAVWADEAMSAHERRHLASLIEELAQGEEERAVFRQHSLAEITRGLVLEQVAAAGPAEKSEVYERCLAVLTSDKHLQSADLLFLGDLRLACGVGFWTHQARLWRLRRSGVRVGNRRGRAVLAVLALCLAAASLSRRRTEFPTPHVSGREVRLNAVALEAEAAGEGAPAELVYRFVSDSFATVEVLVDGTPAFRGSASVIGHDAQGAAYLLTNSHVVKQAVRKGSKLSYKVRFTAAQLEEAELDFISEKSDLALLRLARPAASRPALVLRPRAALAVGQKVFALGSPHGLEHTFTAGIISALREDSLQTDATAAPGSSGGPLLDAQGRLAGVMTRSHVKKDYSFALYADAVLDALNERRTRAGKLLP